MADTMMVDAFEKDEATCSVLSPPNSDALKDGSDSELSELDEIEELPLPLPKAPTTIKEEIHIKPENPSSDKLQVEEETPAKKEEITSPTLSQETTADNADANENENTSIATPAYYDGTVPVFRPDMAHFEDFTSYMNSVNSYGMQSGIIKIIPPPQWKGALPRYDELIKPIKVKDAIRQEILGTTGRFRQLNHVSQRSYNIPQWKALCEQSDHQPPAKRGERRANQRSNGRGGARALAKPATKSAKKPGRRQSKKNADDDNDERLPTPGDSDDEKVAANTSVSARRKFNRKEAATRIDHEAFKDFDYELKEEFTKERCDELERAYWKTLTYASPLYGADHVGTLFDERTKIWNLDKLPNMLDVLGEKIPGVNTAYLYMGMWKATFAWHLEDVDLYSINYLHFGAPKQWYSISQGDARKFENAMASHWPDDAKACDQFLRHKTFLISPSTLLEKHGIKVNKITHHPGEFIVTYPYGYHSGYNLGYNCAEAVNFALDSWLPYGRIAKKCDCSEAQDSVFIDVAHLERKLNGELTPDPTDDEISDNSEDEDEHAEVLTPPESGGEIKIRIKKPGPKRKRVSKNDANDQRVKKIRLNMPRSDTCVLCPHHIPHEKLIKTSQGKNVHRKCAELVPEVSIEGEDGQEVAMGIEDIPKARTELKCGYCSQKKGACFQCTFGKCSRSYHGVCARPAGVHIDEGEIPVYGEDGTEYKTFVQEPRCRFHREKRDKKVTMEDLENDPSIRKAAFGVVSGDTVQFQYMGESYMAGLVVENDKSQACVTIDILPYAYVSLVPDISISSAIINGPSNHRILLDYKWLRFPSISDCRLAKPSARAIPLPKQSLNTSKRMANDLPRKGDEFVQGFKWEEFNPNPDHVRNAAQTKVDFSKDNQLWHYLGKRSTEAKAQYTEDPAKKRHNILANYMDTIPKPIHVSVPKGNAGLPKSNASTSQSAKSKQNALSAVSTKAQQITATDMANKRDRPYIYTPRTETGGSLNTYAIDPQAYRNQQQFLHSSQQSTQRPPLTFGSDPMKYNQTSARYEAADPSAAAAIPSQSQSAKANLDEHRAGESTLGQSPATRSPQSIFNKYPYLQKEHNKSPLDYKSPYRQGGGFLNGYQGNLQEHLKRNPAALMSVHGGAGQSDYAAILPPLPRTLPRPEQSHGAQVRQQSYPEQWGKKTTPDLHPAIRPHFHTTYPSSSSQLPPLRAASHVSGQGAYGPPPVAHMTTTNASDRPHTEYPPILPPQYQSRAIASSATASRPATYGAPQQEYPSRPSTYISSSHNLTSSGSSYAHTSHVPQPSGTSLSAYATSSPKPAYSSYSSQQQYPGSSTYKAHNNAYDQSSEQHDRQANHRGVRDPPPSTYGQHHHSSYRGPVSYPPSQYPSYEQQHSSQSTSAYGSSHAAKESSYQRQGMLPPVLAPQKHAPEAPMMHNESTQTSSHASRSTHVRTPEGHFADLDFPNSMGMVQQIMTDLKKKAATSELH